MSNVVHFPKTDPKVTTVSVDVDEFVFAPLDRLKEAYLTHSVEPADVPTRIFILAARALLDPAFTEQKAKAGGWADLACARQRGIDLLEMVARIDRGS